MNDKLTLYTPLRREANQRCPTVQQIPNWADHFRDGCKPQPAVESNRSKPKSRWLVHLILKVLLRTVRRRWTIRVVDRPACWLLSVFFKISNRLSWSSRKHLANGSVWTSRLRYQYRWPLRFSSLPFSFWARTSKCFGHRSIHKTSETMFSKADAFPLDDRPGYREPRIKKKLGFIGRTWDGNPISFRTLQGNSRRMQEKSFHNCNRLDFCH